MNWHKALALKKMVSKKCTKEHGNNYARQGGLCQLHGATTYIKKTCSANGCTNGPVAHGLCRHHRAATFEATSTQEETSIKPHENLLVEKELAIYRR